jgi:hypothetical protein
MENKNIEEQIIHIQQHKPDTLDHPNKTHGYAAGTNKSPIYRIWRNMKTRCLNPNNKAYKDYGGRGITICDRWMDSFENFLADMGHRPSALHSLDRKDNNLGYSPDNCEWATRIRQSNNRRSNVFILHEGKSQTMADWAREKGLRLGTLHYRIKSGEALESALSRPVIAH